MKLITVKTFERTSDAHLLKAKLESEGIPCYLKDEHYAATSACQGAIGGIKLKIHENDVSRVVEILKEIDNTPFTDDSGKVLSCPKCGSNDIFTDFKSVNGTGGIMASVSAILFHIFPFYWKSSCRCNRCDSTFKR